MRNLRQRINKLGILVSGGNETMSVLSISMSADLIKSEVVDSNKTMESCYSIDRISLSFSSWHLSSITVNKLMSVQSIFGEKNYCKRYRITGRILCKIFLKLAILPSFFNNFLSVMQQSYLSYILSPNTNMSIIIFVKASNSSLFIRRSHFIINNGILRANFIDFVITLSYFNYSSNTAILT